MNSVQDKVFATISPQKKSLVLTKKLGVYNTPVKTLGHYNSPIKRKLGHYNV